MTYPPAAPEILGDVFFLLIQKRQAKAFQALLTEHDYVWARYFRGSGLTPEEQEWAVANRPVVARPRHQQVYQAVA
jgi:hypothetical protein